MFNILIIYFLLFLFLCLKNLKLGIYWVILTLPVYLIRFKIGWLPVTLLECELLVLFVVFFIKYIKYIKTIKIIDIIKNNNRISLFFYFFIFLFLISAIISVFISLNLRDALGIWKAYFIEPILFFIVFIKTIKSKDLKFVFMFLCFNVLMLSLFAIYQKFTGQFIPNEFWAAENTRRVTSIFSYPNALALYLAPIITLLIGNLIYHIKNKITNYSASVPKETMTDRQANKFRLLSYYLVILLHFVTIIAGLMAIYFTKSKGALVAILTGIIFYAIFFKGYRKIFVEILICAFVLFVLFVLFVTGMSNLQGSSTVIGGDSISIRLEMWSETWQMLKTKSILGAGLSGYQAAVAPFHKKDYIEIYLYPHNIFLNFWSETGLFGLMSFILIVGWFYKTGFKVISNQQSVISKKLPITDLSRPFGRELNAERAKSKDYQLPITLMAAMTTLLVHGFVDVPYFKNDLSVLFWVIIGMMMVLWRRAGVV